MSHYKLIAVLTVLLSSPAICCAQTGLVRARKIFVQDPAETTSFTDITDNVIQTRQINLQTQTGSADPDPRILIDAETPVDGIIVISDDEGDTMFEVGWQAGATDFGKLIVYDDSDPDAATSILGPSVTSRTIVLRNLAGSNAAVHLEETGGGTDTVQLRGPASTTGVSFFLPGTDGTAGQCMSTNGSGVLSWAGCAGGTGSSAGATGDVQFSSDGAGTFGADAAFNWENTAKELRLGTAPPTGFTLNVDGELALNNSDGIYWEDAGGTARQVIIASGGDVVFGHTAAPSTGGDSTFASFVGSTEVAITLEARGDNVGVWQPQLTGDGASTNAYYLGDNDNPFTGYIGLGANLIGFGGSPAQILIEEQTATSGGGSGDFITILGGANMSAGYVIGLPDDTPQVGDALIVASQDGAVWNLEWIPGAGGSGCVPSGTAGEVLYSNGSGGCSDDTSLFWDSGNQRLGIRITSPNEPLHVVGGTAGQGVADAIKVQYGGNVGDGGAIVFGNAPTSDHARIYAMTPDGAGRTDFFFESRGVDVLEFDDPTNSWIMPNSYALQFRDAGGAARDVLTSGSGDVFVGHTVQPSSGGDTTISSRANSTVAEMILEARTGGIQVFRRTTASTARAFLGDDNFPFEALISIGVNLLTTGGTPAQLLIEDENSSGNFTTILGAPGTMTGYAFRLPTSAPSASQVLAATTFSGGAWNTAWATIGGGGFTCNTASNCFNLTDAQTVTGQKTFSNHIRFGANDTYEIGSSSTIAAAIYSDVFTAGTTGNSGQITIRDSGAGGTTFTGTSGGVTYNGSITPTFDNTFTLGSSSLQWIGWFQSMNITGDINGSGGGGGGIDVNSSNWSPAVNNSRDLGWTSGRWRRLYIGTAINAPNGSNGFSGSCGSSTTLTVSGGVITGCS